jgi:limonene-1,2-epoxide hydrolase
VSGRQVSLPAVWVVEVEGDKAKAVRHYFDLMTLLAQIGAVPAGTS